MLPRKSFQPIHGPDGVVDPDLPAQLVCHQPEPTWCCHRETSRCHQQCPSGSRCTRRCSSNVNNPNFHTDSVTLHRDDHCCVAMTFTLSAILLVSQGPHGSVGLIDTAAMINVYDR